MQVFTNQARDRIQGQRRSLENDVRQFQQQEATMAADARQKRAEALQQREQNLQNSAAREENVLKAAMAAAHNEVAKQMEPIMQADRRPARREHGAGQGGGAGGDRAAIRYHAGRHRGAGRPR